MIPMVENEIRQQEQQLQQAEAQLDRSDCYEYFLFSKTLRRTRNAWIFRARSRRRGGESVTSRRRWRSFRRLPGARIRTTSSVNSHATIAVRPTSSRRGSSLRRWRERCLERRRKRRVFAQSRQLRQSRLRDLSDDLRAPLRRYYFPVSFSTLPNHFEQDAQVCASKCAAPAELFYHQNPGQGVDQAVSATSQQPYTQLKTAFRYRKEFVPGCSCKMAEYVPDPSQPQTQQQGAVSPQPGAAQAAAAGASSGTASNVDGWSTGVESSGPQSQVSVAPLLRQLPPDPRLPRSRCLGSVTGRPSP